MTKIFLIVLCLCLKNASYGAEAEGAVLLYQTHLKRHNCELIKCAEQLLLEKSVCCENLIGYHFRDDLPHPVYKVDYDSDDEDEDKCCGYYTCTYNQTPSSSPEFCKNPFIRVEDSTWEFFSRIEGIVSIDTLAKETARLRKRFGTDIIPDTLGTFAITSKNQEVLFVFSFSCKACYTSMRSWKGRFSKSSKSSSLYQPFPWIYRIAQVVPILQQIDSPTPEGLMLSNPNRDGQPPVSTVASGSSSSTSAASTMPQPSAQSSHVVSWTSPATDRSADTARAGRRLSVLFKIASGSAAVRTQLLESPAWSSTVSQSVHLTTTGHSTKRIDPKKATKHLRNALFVVPAVIAPLAVLTSIYTKK